MLTLLALHTLLGVAQAAFPCDGAATDGDIYWAGVLHDSFDKTYREPFGAAPAGGVVELRLRACRRDLSLVRVRVWDAKARKETWISLRVAAGVVDPELGAVEYWVGELPLPTSPTIFYYFFELQDGADTDYYVDDEPVFYGGGPGEMSDAYDDTRSFQVSVYDPTFDVPDWLGRLPDLPRPFPRRRRHQQPRRRLGLGLRRHLQHRPGLGRDAHGRLRRGRSAPRPVFRRG